MADKEIPFYSVSSAVGPGCPNKRTDVMLVQFFLHQIYSHPTKLNKPAGPKIAINGTFDSTTAAWIKHYQNDVKNQGRPIYPDGRIDRAKGEQYSFSSLSKTGYTITFLNFGHCERYRREHDRLEQHVLMPGELKAELARGEPLPM
jgi:hypothetical protein